MESEEKPIYQLGIDPRRDMTVLLWSSDRKKPARFYIQNRNYTQDNREAKGTYEVMKLYNENPETFQKNVIDAIKALSRTEIKESKKEFKEVPVEKKRKPAKRVIHVTEISSGSETEEDDEVEVRIPNKKLTKEEMNYERAKSKVFSYD